MTYYLHKAVTLTMDQFFLGRNYSTCILIFIRFVERQIKCDDVFVSPWCCDYTFEDRYCFLLNKMSQVLFKIQISLIILKKRHCKKQHHKIRHRYFRKYNW